MKFLVTAVLNALLAFAVSVHADTNTRPDSHAPIGVMGEHTHAKGEWMLSYRYMHMAMKGNRDGNASISTEKIATTAPNIFAGMPMQPPTLRVVPTEMTMDMHMLGVMYAPNDRVTLMGMANYVKKDMKHTTFMGGMGTQVLGTFRTQTQGIGDTSLSGLIKLTDTIHGTLGVSLPTGETSETGKILTPMNMQPRVRLPYPMQLGSGTYDAIVGLTYAEMSAVWGWGSQWRSVIRTGDNDEEYSLGDEHSLTGWLSYTVNPRLSIASRLAYLHRGNIDGADPQIVAPVQTADPNRQGMERIDLLLSANYLLGNNGQRLALELGLPMTQDLDGPQLETDWMMTLGWQWTP
jgi:hypothetical protein